MTLEAGRLFYVPHKRGADLPSQVKNWDAVEVFLNGLQLRETGAIGGGEPSSGGGAPSPGDGASGDTHYESTGIYLEIDGTWTLVFVKYLDSEAVTAMGVKGDANALNHDRYATADHDAETHDAADLADVELLTGTATPEAAVTAAVGALFLRTDGGAGTTLYVKESGAGNTGWVAK